MIVVTYNIPFYNLFRLVIAINQIKSENKEISRQEKMKLLYKYNHNNQRKERIKRHKSLFWNTRYKGGITICLFKFISFDKEEEEMEMDVVEIVEEEEEVDNDKNW